MLVIIVVCVSFIFAVKLGTVIPLIVGMAASLVVLAAKMLGLETKDKKVKEYYEVQIELLKKRVDRLEKGITKEPGEKPAIVEEIVEEKIEEKREEIIEEPAPVEIEAEPVKEEAPAQLKIKTDGKLIFEIPPETPDVKEEPVPPEPEKEEIPAGEAKEPETPLEAEEEIIPGETREAEIEIPIKEKETYPMWENLQQRFIENWTGILGSIIMVMGVGFLGIYTALKVSPPYRFGMTVLFSMILFGIFLYLRSKSKWIQFAMWLRSSAGAIFLFACLGSSTMEGLKWLDNPLEGTGLLLLILGIGFNLVLAFAGGRQVFASLHVLLSLVALAIAPPNLITFVAAVIITLFGIALTYREKWEYHLLLTISLFFAYHLYWYYNAALKETAKIQHLTGIISVVLVGVLTMLVHYRSLYRTTVFERLPFFVHFINWFYSGIGLYLHSFGSPWKPAVIASASIAAFSLARKARKIGIQWLYVTDTLAAQAIMLYALFSVYRWKVDSFFTIGMMFLETLLFLAVMITEKEKFLSMMGSILKYIFGAALFIYAFVNLRSADVSTLTIHGLTLSVCLVFTVIFHLYLLRKFGEVAGSFAEAGDSLWRPFIVYFVHIFYAGYVLYLFFLDWRWKAPVIALLSIVIYITARKAKSTGIRPLYIFGTLVAQAAALLAVGALSQWHVPGHFITGIMFIETMLFLLLMIKENDRLLCNIATFMKYTLGIILLAWGFFLLESHPDSIKLYRSFIVISVCAGFGTLFHVYLVKAFANDYETLSKTPDRSWLNPLLYFIHIFYAGAAVYFYSVDWSWKPAVIGLISLTGFIAARWVKSIGTKCIYINIYRTGTLVAQVAALLALLSLSQLKVDDGYIYALMFIESLLFLVYMIKENEELFRKLGTWSFFMISFVLIAVSLGNINYENIEILYKHAGIFLVCIAAVTLFHIYTLRKFGETFAAFKTPASNQDGVPLNVHQVSGFGILIGVLLLGAFINIYRFQWWVYILAAVGMVLIYIRHRFQSNGLGFGLLIFVLLIHAFGWNYMSLTDHAPVTEKIIYCLPFLVLTFTGIRMPYLTWAKRSMKAVGIYLFFLHLVIASLYTFSHVSPFAAGTLWLLVSIITLELARRLRGKYGSALVEKGEPDRFLLHVGYLLIAGFLVRHLVVHLDRSVYIGMFRLRLVVALAAVLIFIYWALRRLPERENSSRLHEYLHPLFLELIIFFSVLTVAVEVDSRWFPLVWIVTALSFMLAGRSLRGETSRIRFYSLLFYWASAVYVAMIPGIVAEASGVTPWYANPGTIDTVVIVLQFVYILLIHKLPFLEGVSFPRLLASLKDVSDFISRRKNPWINYPLFISVAIFLYQSFSRAILTLLWVVECFFIFISSVILKENHFRYVAMTGLALALLRLVFYDMAKSNTLTRALVFIGVGVIMLVMNSIYNKYKDRF
jgi:hypothetical protein